MARMTLILLFIIITFVNGLDNNLLSFNNIILNKWDKLNNRGDVMTGILTGLSVVFVAGFGDKTFFMNMIYASINPFWEAFFVSLTVSEFMNLISLFLGEVIPHLISRDIIDWIAIALFGFFGFVLLFQGIFMDSSKLSEEIEAINNENNDKGKGKGKDEDVAVGEPLLEVKIESEDEGNRIKPKEPKKKGKKLGVFDSWWKYSLAFMVAELGDKSQIATIVITAKYDFMGVIIGTSTAQLLLVVSSIFLGKTIAVLLTKKQITIISALVFLCFSVIYLLSKLLAIEE